MPDPLFHDMHYCGQQLRVESAQFCSEHGAVEELPISDQAPTPAAASKITATIIIRSHDLFFDFPLQSQGAPLQHLSSGLSVLVVLISILR